MNLLKKSLSVLAVAAMAVSLAGCGGSSSSSKSTDSGEKVFRFGQSSVIFLAFTSSLNVIPYIINAITKSVVNSFVLVLFIVFPPFPYW